MENRFSSTFSFVLHVPFFNNVRGREYELFEIVSGCECIILVL